MKDSYEKDSPGMTNDGGEETRPAIDNHLFYQAMVDKHGSWEQYLETVTSTSKAK